MDGDDALRGRAEESRGVAQPQKPMLSPPKFEYFQEIARIYPDL
jgi:hypothetical protein